MPDKKRWKTSKQDFIRSLLILDKEGYNIFNENRGWFLSKHGYVETKVDGKHWKLHQLIIGMKSLPGFCIDHINGNIYDNRKENLRIVPLQVNSMNKKNKRKDSKQIYMGVQLLPSGKYRAKGENGKHLGVFETPEEAKEKYEQYKKLRMEKCYGIV